MPMPNENFDRNYTIAELVEGGELTLDAIGKMYGLTRERVRQIGNKYGVVPRMQAHNRKHQAIARSIKRLNLTMVEAKATHGVHASTVATALRKFGGKVRKRGEIDFKYGTPEIVAMAEKVKQGMSIRQAAGTDHSVEALLARYCHSHGISSLHGRWNVKSFEKRMEVIVSMRAERKGWDEIAEVVAKEEGRRIGPMSLYNWWLGRKKKSEKST